MSRKRAPLIERVTSKLQVSQVTGCHEFTGHINQAGYGTILVDGRGSASVGVHRVAYEAAKGPIPDGLVIDHLCRNTRCCNPDHLEAVTPRENTLRGVSPMAENARKTHCIHGHEFTPENTYVRADGNRDCKRCNKERERNRAPRQQDRTHRYRKPLASEEPDGSFASDSSRKSEDAALAARLESVGGSNLRVRAGEDRATIKEAVVRLRKLASPAPTADFTRSLPGGKLDDSEYEAVESALDRADAPCRAADGRWLTLAERVAALSPDPLTPAAGRVGKAEEGE